MSKINIPSCPTINIQLDVNYSFKCYTKATTDNQLLAQQTIDTVSNVSKLCVVSILPTCYIILTLSAGHNIVDI